MTQRRDSQLDPDLLQALGELLVEHAALEEALRDGLWLEAKTDKILVHILLSGLSCKALIDKFGAVYYEHHSAHRSSTSTLCNHLQKLNDQRNTLVHSFWTTAAGSPEAVRLKLRATPQTGLVIRSEGVSASAVRELARGLRNATDKVWELIVDLSLPPATKHGAG